MNRYLRTVPRLTRRFFASSSRLQPINFNQYFAASMNTTDGQNYSMSFNYDRPDPITVHFTGEDKVRFLKEELCRCLNISDIQILSVDRIEIASETLLSDLEFEQIYIYSAQLDFLVKVTKPFTKQKMRRWEKSSLISDRKDFENLHMPYLYEKTILNYLNRISIEGETISKNDLIKELLSKTPNSRISSSLSIDFINEEFQSLYEEYQRLNKTRSEALRKGQRFARSVLFLGLLALGGQIALVVFGVYVYYNWDIMEPIMYFLQYAGVLAIGSLFFLMRSKYENQRFAQWLVNWYQRRHLTRIKFDFNRYEQVTQLLRENHQHRLKNILNDF